jgi:ABC-type sugar transport system permease subunit
MTNQTASLPLNKPRLPWRHLPAYLFVLPYLLVMLAFGLGPGLYALLLSFADFSTGLPE